MATASASNATRDGDVPAMMRSTAKISSGAHAAVYRSGGE
jgi:hypothetical protein